MSEEELLMKEKQKLQDFEILKSIVEGKTNIKDLDRDVKIRLIDICNRRLDEINKKIEDTKSEINKIESLILKNKK